MICRSFAGNILMIHIGFPTRFVGDVWRVWYAFLCFFFFCDGLSPHMFRSSSAEQCWDRLRWLLRLFDLLFGWIEFWIAVFLGIPPSFRQAHKYMCMYVYIYIYMIIYIHDYIYISWADVVFLEPFSLKCNFLSRCFVPRGRHRPIVNIRRK